MFLMGTRKEQNRIEQNGTERHGDKCVTCTTKVPSAALCQTLSYKLIIFSSNVTVINSSQPFINILSLLNQVSWREKKKKRQTLKFQGSLNILQQTIGRVSIHTPSQETENVSQKRLHTLRGLWFVLQNPFSRPNGSYSFIFLCVCVCILQAFFFFFSDYSFLRIPLKNR